MDSPQALESEQHAAGVSAREHSQPKFVPIPMQEWHKLRDIYLKNWPKHSFSYYTLNNYIEWSVKDADMCKQDVHISSVDNNWHEHGTYLLEDRTKNSNTIQLDTSASKDDHLVTTALRNLDPAPFYTILYRENTRPLVEQRLIELNCKDFSQGYCPTTLYHLPREDCLKLEIRPIAGFVVRPLDLANVARINDLWTYKHPDSDYLISRVVKHNPNLGAYEAKTGNLAGWVLRSELGTIAFLQVEEVYQRRGLAVHLVSKLCRLLAERGFDAIANISDTNVPSMRLFQKLGFQPIDRVYWYDKQAVELQKGVDEQFEQATVGLKHG